MDIPPCHFGIVFASELSETLGRPHARAVNSAEATWGLRGMGVLAHECGRVRAPLLSLGALLLRRRTPQLLRREPAPAQVIENQFQIPFMFRAQHLGKIVCYQELYTTYFWGSSSSWRRQELEMLQGWNKSDAW